MKWDVPEERLHALPVQLGELPDGIVLKRGRVEIRISGASAADVVRTIIRTALHGATRTELGSLVAAPERADVLALVDHLVARRILVAENDGPGAHAETQLDVFYWHFGTDRQHAEERLDQQRISVLGVNHIARRLVEGLRAAGVTSCAVLDHPMLRNPEFFGEGDALSERAWPETLGPRPAPVASALDVNPQSTNCLVATSDLGAVRELRAWNEFCVLHGIRFVPVVLADLVGHVGPVVVPGDSACYECLWARLNTHLADPDGHWAAATNGGDGQAVAGLHPSMASILGDIATVELIKLFGLAPPLARFGTLIEVNLLGGAMKTRRVLKVPRCEVCSSRNKVPPTTLSRGLLFSFP